MSEKDVDHLIIELDLLSRHWRLLSGNVSAKRRAADKAVLQPHQMRNRSRANSQWGWHLDEVFVRINSKTDYLWRTMKRYGQPRVIVTDRRRSYWAAMNVIGNAADQGCGWWLNNRAENLHQTFRRREGEISKFWDVKTQQKFASIQTSVHNQFNLERHLTPRETFKQSHAAAMAEWLQLAA